MILGADIGGTFTDLVWWTGQQLLTYKLSTTPAQPEDALLTGIEHLGAARPDVLLVHGSTIATNAFLERTGARVLLITTAGFADVLEIARQNRANIYDARAPKPQPLVPRELRIEAHERLDAEGNALEPLSDAEIARIARTVAEQRPEAIAICLLHAYANPAHEQRLSEALRAASPFVYCSSAIDPAYREYERMCTTVLNAYVAPRVAEYLERLRMRVSGPFRLIGSHGGRETSNALERPANMILSGPAGGVMGAVAVSRAAGESEIISLDMGGTSTDVALIPGSPLMSRETLLEGLPLRAPMLDITTIGAGGGSIARLDRGGALVVGPQSAGAIPGPACYGRGGTRFTVTDAHLLLGHLLPEAFLGGRMTLDAHAARATAETANLGRTDDVRAFASGVIAVANAAMERAIRGVAARKGYDPADFTLFCFGGSGGLHAIELARALGMRGILVPRLAGVLSALGMVLADTLCSARASLLRELAEITEAELTARFAQVAAECEQRLLADGYSLEQIQVSPELELRYRGQSYELAIPWRANREATAAAFHREHERRFGYADRERAIEAVNIAVTVRGVNAGFSLPELAAGEPAAPMRTVEAWFGEQPHATEVYLLSALARDQRITGPALLAGDYTTVLLPPGTIGQIDRFGNVRVSLRN
ncbi:MAG: N-methylhydantoinase A [Ktedonobacterales bacterium]|jgi:N-methylhydantoinase A|nr:MAG: N-methylhydantoinase A [Ktedonobacterales bacterium]